MNKLTALLQILGAAAFLIAGLATLVNLLLIANRPETISVVNAIIGQGFMIICLIAIANILFKKAKTRFKAAPDTDSAS